MDGSSSEYEVGIPHPRLRPFVSGYTGYRLVGFEPGVHVGLPSGSLTFIVAFDEPLEVSGNVGSGGRDCYWAMLAGLHTHPAHIHHSGSQHGVQLAITPRGAGVLFGMPAAEFASSIVHLDQVVPTIAGELIDQLSTASTWRARWAALDRLLLRVLRTEMVMPPELEHAWYLLRTSHGSMAIEEVAAEVGWSRRHLGQRFRREFGLSPKTMGRVLRFERAQRLVRLPTRPSLASVAASCGYADQAHMTRDWRQFAGRSPTSWLLEETIPFVQDDREPLPSP